MSQEILDALQRIERRMDKIEAKLETHLKHPSQELNAALTTLTNTIDDYGTESDTKRWQLAANAAKTTAILEKLPTSDIVDLVERLLDNLPKIQQMLDTLESLPNAISILTDTVDEQIANLKQTGIDPQEFNNQFSILMKRLIEQVESGSLGNFLDSGILDKNSVEIVSVVGKSLATGARETRKISLFSLLVALNNKDFKHALCFLVDFAQQFGKHLQTSHKGNSL
jgi:uncharacterized protein YjgD (DUF1641 family)